MVSWVDERMNRAGEVRAAVSTCRDLSGCRKGWKDRLGPKGKTACQLHMTSFQAD